MTRRVHLDANIILRFLRNDDPQQSRTAAELFKQAEKKELQLLASPVTIMEVFYVLARAYGMPRPEVARILQTLIGSGLALCEDGGIALDALRRITSNKTSFGDAYLMAAAAQANEEIVTFDQGILASKDVRLYPLNSISKSSKK
ncbi:MAG: PIN domain-containing protein [Verrucomicrobiota bacterium]|jgi:predicted nucleic-acid-binding protein